MSDITYQIAYLNTIGRHYGPGDQEAWTSRVCPWCGSTTQAVIAHIRPHVGESMNHDTSWLRCPQCFKGSVVEEEALHPGVRPFRIPEGLPSVDARIWAEALKCLSAGAWSAAVMLCRKLLLHIAVDKGLPAKNDRDRAPGFAEATDYLEAQGVITPPMREWVNDVKDVGNDANHELDPIDETNAMNVATFTLQILVLAYEMSALRSSYRQSREAVGDN